MNQLIIVLPIFIITIYLIYTYVYNWGKGDDDDWELPIVGKVVLPSIWTSFSLISAICGLLAFANMAMEMMVPPPPKTWKQKTWKEKSGGEKALSATQWLWGPFAFVGRSLRTIFAPGTINKSDKYG